MAELFLDEDVEEEGFMIVYNLKEEFENKKESPDFFRLLELIDFRDDFSYK